MTTPDRLPMDVIEWMIENARPDQLERLLADIRNSTQPLRPTHTGPKRIQ